MSVSCRVVTVRTATERAEAYCVERFTKKEAEGCELPSFQSDSIEALERPVRTLYTA